MNTNKQDWDDLSARRIASNIATANARKKWQTAININTFGKSGDEIIALNVERILAKAEYQRCHSEALALADEAKAAYFR